MAASDKNCCVSLTRCFFDYSTPKTLVIRSKTVGAINRLCQALVIAYIIGYVCVWKKGYQDTDTVISSVTTKVKGIALTNTSDLGTRIWDVADYIIPPQEENSFFVLTNLNITPNQTQSHCPENPGPESSCSSDQDCKKGFRNGRLSGVRTGRCVHFSERIKTCEVLAWCPLEKYDEPPDPPMLAEAENFTVLIKNSVRYPKFNFSRRNILPHINSTYLTKCVFSRDTDPDCPIFSLRDIVAEAGEDFQAMAVHGGVMGVQIRWDCDLDMPANWCVPRYTFRRLDNKDPENNVAPGYNFRFAKYYKSSNGEEIRTLIKGYGIRFDIMVFGKVSLSSGSVHTKLAKLEKRHLYRERKYSYVDDFQLVSFFSFQFFFKHMLLLYTICPKFCSHPSNVSFEIRGFKQEYSKYCHIFYLHLQLNYLLL
uniref:P2X purinoceptor n=1 Tax=Astyanax mexicanus TaxID=7994 RepID=A0A8B9LAU9_ASTMX